MSKELVLAATVSILVHLGLYHIEVSKGNGALKEIRRPVPLKVVLINSDPPPKPSPMAENAVRPLAKREVLSASPPRYLPMAMKKILSGSPRRDLSLKDVRKEEERSHLDTKRMERMETRMEDVDIIKTSSQSRRPMTFEPREVAEKKGFSPLESKEEVHEEVERKVARSRPIFKAVPRYRLNPLPPYPLSARKRGFEGSTLLKVEVLANGRVGQIIIERSAGYPVLDRSAIKTVKKWLFEPGREGDRPVAMWIKIPIRFKLR